MQISFNTHYGFNQSIRQYNLKLCTPQYFIISTMVIFKSQYIFFKWPSETGYSVRGGGFMWVENLFAETLGGHPSAAILKLTTPDDAWPQ